jgi:hypothetical protein
MNYPDPQLLGLRHGKLRKINLMGVNEELPFIGRGGSAQQANERALSGAVAAKKGSDRFTFLSKVKRSLRLRSGHTLSGDFQ